MTYLATIGSMFLLYQVMLWGMCHDNAGRHKTKHSTAHDWAAYLIIVVLPFAVAVGAGVLIASAYM